MKLANWLRSLLALLTLACLAAATSAQSAVTTSASAGRPDDAGAVRRPPMNLRYPQNPARYARGVRIPANRPTPQGGGVLFTVSPQLPAGVHLDPGDGTISGLPLVSTPSTLYVVTATNAAGSVAELLDLATDAFGLVATTVAPGDVWEVNRPIDLLFNGDVDLTSVSPSTVRVRTPAGAQALGTFSHAPDPSGGVALNTVRFQPRCPLTEDLSELGLQPLSAYALDVPDATTTGFTVRSISGQALEVGRLVTFQTPSSLDPAVLFFDPGAGPPAPVVRNAGSLEQQATYIEVGGDTANRTYFEYDPATMSFGLEDPSFLAPRNLYADPSSRVALYLELDQPVAPAAANLARLGLEYLDGGAVWQPFRAAVELLANCNPDGATVRLTPDGPLPHASQLRVVIGPGFEDLVGQAVSIGAQDFAVAPTEGITLQSLTPPDDGADELLEEFLTDRYEDEAFQPSTRLARWENGALSASIDVGSTGGPGGDFDFFLPTGQSFLFDTTSQVVVGGPGGVPISSVTVLNGDLQVRDFIIEPGAHLRVIGPNPLRIQATGRVEIHGTLDLSGFPAKDVATLSTGDIPEQGGAGVAGGGKGGDASVVTTSSTPRGNRGAGAFGAAGSAGGEGGESGYAPAALGKDARRPGGGGGGALGAPRSSSNQSFAPQDGYDGHPSSRGAESNQSPARGGAAGIPLDTNGDPDDDHWGVRAVFDPLTGQFTELRRGELQPTAGAGGGGGGDAIPAAQFPHPSWTPGTDEKGGAGGGAAGQLRVRALGPIVFGVRGRIIANGGGGAKGGNSALLPDHVGGSGGGGSGGHVILETAATIDFTDGSQNDLDASGAPYIQARGGLGGVGTSVAGWSRGGDGGPGVVQLHVPHPDVKAERHPLAGGPGNASIYVPFPLALAVDPLELAAEPPGYALVSELGVVSKARSKWISVGHADEQPGGGPDPYVFLFDGVEAAPGSDQGKVLTTGGVVTEVAPVLGPEAITGNVVVESSGSTLAIAGASLLPWINDTGVPSKDLYLREPALLRSYVLRLVDNGGNSSKDFSVQAADYDDAAQRLRLTVDVSTGNLSTFVASSVQPAYMLVPRFFQVSTLGAPGVLQTTSSVRFTFEATGADANGDPDESNVLARSGDLSSFNALAPGTLRFFRFEVEFDLDTPRAGVTRLTLPVDLEHLRVPFRF